MVSRRTRRTGLAALALGLGIAAAAQLAAPLATPPLYDGVVVVQPYVYVNPPAGKPGGAKGASAHLALSGSKSPLVALATPEQPPQAQVVAGDGTLVLPATATALDVSITPLDPSVDAAAASTARVLGNVYRFALADQSGDAATAPASALVTVVLRAPEDAPGATLGQLVDGAWHALKSEPMFGSTYVAVVTSFGDFAVIVPGGSTPSSGASGLVVRGDLAARPAGSDDTVRPGGRRRLRRIPVRSRARCHRGPRPAGLHRDRNPVPGTSRRERPSRQERPSLTRRDATLGRWLLGTQAPPRQRGDTTSWEAPRDGRFVP